MKPAILALITAVALVVSVSSADARPPRYFSNSTGVYPSLYSFPNTPGNRPGYYPNTGGLTPMTGNFVPFPSSSFYSPAGGYGSYSTPSYYGGYSGGYYGSYPGGYSGNYYSVGGRVFRW